MYPDEYFHPNNNEIYAKSSLLFDIKQNDKHFHSVKKWNPVKQAKTKVEFYSCYGVGNRIRNAITGELYRNCLIGSKSDDHFFKIKICNGDTGVEGATCYYETPEDYERHNFEVVDKETKKRWLEKQHTIKKHDG